MVTGMAEKKNAAAVSLGKRRAALAAPGEMAALGRKGGSAGGPARAQALTKEERRVIAQKGAQARWGKNRKGKRKAAA